VRDLLSSSEHLGVTIPETIALRRLVERVDQWKDRVRAALDGSVAQIHELISAETLRQEKPTSNHNEIPESTDQSDLPSSLRTSPEFGITSL